MAQAKMRDLIINAIKREAADKEGVVAFSDREILELIQKHFKKNPSLSAVSQSRNLMAKAGIAIQVDKVGSEKLWTLVELMKKVEEPVRDEKIDTVENTSTTQTLNEYTVDDVIHTLDKHGLVLDAILDLLKRQEESIKTLFLNQKNTASNHNLLVSRLDGITKVLGAIADAVNTKHLQTKQIMHKGFDDLNNHQIRVFEQMQKVEDTWAKVMNKADGITQNVMEAYKEGMSEGVRTMVTLNEELAEKKNQEKIDTLTKIISGPRNGG